MIGAIIARNAVKSGFDALNERNVDKFMKAWAGNCEWVYPGIISVSGTFKGKDNVRKWFQHFQDQFPARKFIVTHLGVGNIFAMGGSNVISAVWKLDLVNKAGESYSMNGVTVLTIKGAKVVRGLDFSDNIGDNFKRMWGELK